MRAEILCVGTELLLGNIVNTNAALIARSLAIWGIDCYHHSTVGDNLDRAIAGLRVALERADAVIVTGGIGPTPDDCTREALAQVLGVELTIPPDCLATLEARYASWGRTPSGSSFKQASLPVGSVPIANPTGSAVGVLAAPADGPYAGRVVYLLPGVPSEMERMLAESVIPDLRARFGLTSGLFQRVLHVRGLGESVLADLLDDLLVGSANPTVATYVKNAEVEVRLTCRADDQDAAEALFGPTQADIVNRLGPVVYGIDDETYERQLGRLLSARQATLVTAESCTGGQVGDRITAVPGSSAWYLGGVVAYANRLKESLLGVDPALLAAEGAVSAPVAAAMAEGALDRLGGDYALAVTGIAGPGGGTEAKPVGLIYVAWARRVDGRVEVLERRLTGNRELIKERTALTALEMACQRLANEAASPLGEPQEMGTRS
ncbi:MAG TPA: competence/damage-inducible protein A [Armatimonadetes bacterium]|nr:competence/damage-inducible protein A [Armatimonadota bacterium]